MFGFQGQLFQTSGPPCCGPSGPRNFHGIKYFLARNASLILEWSEYQSKDRFHSIYSRGSSSLFLCSHIPEVSLKLISFQLVARRGDGPLCECFKCAHSARVSSAQALSRSSQLIQYPYKFRICGGNASLGRSDVLRGSALQTRKAAWSS